MQNKYIKSAKKTLKRLYLFLSFDIIIINEREDIYFSDKPKGQYKHIKILLMRCNYGKRK
ncbi:hypothetical protein ACFGW1_10965, partial [Pasteurella multocida]